MKDAGGLTQEALAIARAETGPNARYWAWIALEYAAIDRADTNPGWAVRILSAVRTDRLKDGAVEERCYDTLRAEDTMRRRLTPSPGNAHLTREPK